MCLYRYKCASWSQRIINPLPASENCYTEEKNTSLFEEKVFIHYISFPLELLINNYNFPQPVFYFNIDIHGNSFKRVSYFFNVTTYSGVFEAAVSRQIA